GQQRYGPRGRQHRPAGLYRSRERGAHPPSGQPPGHQPGHYPGRDQQEGRTACGGCNRPHCLHPRPASSHSRPPATQVHTLPYGPSIRYRTVMAEQNARGQRRLTRDDWITAALAAIADGGLAAVGVEPLAARLGATKGSFYWHFENRDALLEAAIRRWEKQTTTDVAAEITAARDPPASQLRRLL